MSGNKFNILDEWIKKETSLGTKDDNTEVSIEEKCDDLLLSLDDINALYTYFEERVNRFNRRKHYTTTEQKLRYAKVVAIMDTKKQEFEKDGASNSNDGDDNNIPTGNEETDDIIITNVSPDNNNQDEKKRPDILKYLEDAWKKRDVKFQRLYTEEQHDYPYGYNLGTENAEEEQATGRAALHDKNRLVLESSEITQFVATMEGIKEAGHKSITLDLKGTEEEKKAFAAKAIVAGMVAGIEIKGSPYDLKDLKQFDERIEKVMQVEEFKKKIDNAMVDDKESDITEAISQAYDTYTQVAKDLIPPKDQLKVFESGVAAAKHQKIKSLAQAVYQQRQQSNS